MLINLKEREIMNKDIYEEVKIRVVVFDAEDVITDSSCDVQFCDSETPGVGTCPPKNA